MSKLLKKNLKGLKASFNVLGFAHYRGGGSYEG